MTDSLKTRVEHMKLIHTTLLFIGERAQITFTLTTANVFSSGEQTQVSARNLSNTVRFSARVDLDSAASVQQLICSLYESFQTPVTAQP